MKKCHKTHKTKFRTEKDASRAIMRIWSHDPSADIFDLHFYKCDACGFLHVGHKSYYEKARAKQESYTSNVQPSNQN